MSILSQLRRLVLGDDVSIRRASLRLRMSRNTATRWLQLPEMDEPRHPKQASRPGILAPTPTPLGAAIQAVGQVAPEVRT